MENFIYHSPTKLYFGENAIENLPELVAEKGKKVLLCYGGGSIKKIGLYDEVIKLLEGCEVYELSGIEPNPKYSTSVLEGVKICKENNIELVLAVGGGSVLDCAKTIAAGAKYDGETWDLIVYEAETTDTLPVITVVTLAATGSEYDDSAVITRTETNEKTDYIVNTLRPYASIMDPKYTYSVSKRQTIAGTIDAISHVMEQYFCEKHSMLFDGICESVVRTLLHFGKIAIDEPENYEARSELLMACSLGCNGLLALGSSESGWPLHALEHTLSGFYDITHGEGLAIIIPRWMEYILNNETVERFVSFGTHCYGIDSNLPDAEIANLTIKKTYETFEIWGSPMHLKDVGIDEEKLTEMAEHIVSHTGISEAWVPLDVDDIVTIFKNSL